MDEGLNKVYEDIVKNEFPGFVQMLERCMNFERWGFKQTFYGLAPEFVPSVIYDSESCRVRFLWYRADPRDGYPTLDIKYGRLHASNHKRFITWNGQWCYCWHDIKMVLNFLDGLHPHEAVKMQNKWPRVIDQFIQSNKGRTWSEIEWTARTHAAVWEHYENRLFDLFDLRHSDLWEQFARFIKEFYRLDPGVLNPSAPWPEKIC